MNHREVGYALLRITAGVIFLWFVDMNRFSLDSLFRRRTTLGFTS